MQKTTKQLSFFKPFLPTIIKKIPKMQKNAFNIFYLDGKTDFHQEFSDHKMISFPKLACVDPDVREINSMMQGLKPHQTAFQIIESDLAYKHRLRKIAYELAQNLRESCIIIQEGPIKNEDLAIFFTELRTNLPSNWQVAESQLFTDTTDMGIITIINKNLLKCKEINTLDITGARKDLKNRCRTYHIKFNNEDEYYISNVHLPHNNPESAFDDFFPNVVSGLLEQIECKQSFKHHIYGDLNIDSEVLVARMNKYLEDFATKLKFPFEISISMNSSKHGHLKIFR